MKTQLLFTTHSLTTTNTVMTKKQKIMIFKKKTIEK